MKRREKLFALTISGIMVLAILLTWAPVGAENPPTGTHFQGPAMSVDIEFRAATSGDAGQCQTDPAGMIFSASEVKCGNKTFNWETQFSCCQDYTYAEVNEESLKGRWVTCAEPQIYKDCAPDGVTIDGLVIQAVKNYDDTSKPGVKKATVTILFVVPSGK